MAENQLPKNLRSNCRIVRDGLDTRYLGYQEINLNKSPLVTYGTRGMEPTRNFENFIRLIPRLVKRCPSIQIEIAGNDKICYGGNGPGMNLSWGQWAKKYLKHKNCHNNVIWRGLIPYNEYKLWLQKSWCHIYLSKPFVCSWSLLDALATGVPIAASDVEPVREYCETASEAIW